MGPKRGTIGCILISSTPFTSKLENIDSEKNTAGNIIAVILLQDNSRLIGKTNVKRSKKAGM
ncbi:MAG: hypothetical protein A2898_03080 [Candidatus Kerfeldbacteria bacterium RIFCSPLOWO2_01_FULL_48_11]|uniref:Uncharacterized protein n=1 Tax=Candidatus Kerfeldbacteria bacterium RIFCSPLOWO2_01_FULL_48_11 TaxID=1798543 RepID=A0A1G2B6F9_9BACT|nr:MAG: hypothetical protein A2898_03080 [Candidatus Kerfeldbacteria bacterium RIFCSPLOWO2_01_FULL_48_11]HCM68018.1 hypothetical protein [Candidatus Kerfeldbacteria bacterium]